MTSKFYDLCACVQKLATYTIRVRTVTKLEFHNILCINWFLIVVLYVNLLSWYEECFPYLRVDFIGTLLTNNYLK